MSRQNESLFLLAGMGIGLYLASRLVRYYRLHSRPDYFQGKTVIITGASRGIGRELALAFARRGANLVLASRSQDQLLRVGAEIGDINRDLDRLIVRTDVTDEDDLQHLVDTTLNHYGQIDILVNNAGIIQGGDFVGNGPESLRKQIEVNLMAAIRLTQLALPAMLARGKGHIVNMVSASGRHSVPYYVAYGASKHAMIGFSDALRRELAKTGVRVLTINPGFTQTDIVAVAQVAYKKMGFKMIPPELIARRTLEGLVLGRVEVNIGWLEYVGGLASKSFPRVTDLYWRLFMPPDFPEIVSGQRTE